MQRIYASYLVAVERAALTAVGAVTDAGRPFSIMLGRCALRG